MLLLIQSAVFIYFKLVLIQPNLFGHLLDRSGDFVLFVVDHRETEQLLDAAVVRHPGRTLFLDGGPQGLTVRICKGPERGELVTCCGHQTVGENLCRG